MFNISAGLHFCCYYADKFRFLFLSLFMIYKTSSVKKKQKKQKKTDGSVRKEMNSNYVPFVALERDSASTVSGSKQIIKQFYQSVE